MKAIFSFFIEILQATEFTANDMIWRNLLIFSQDVEFTANYIILSNGLTMKELKNYFQSNSFSFTTSWRIHRKWHDFAKMTKNEWIIVISKPIQSFLFERLLHICQIRRKWQMTWLFQMESPWVNFFLVYVYIWGTNPLCYFTI